MSEMIINIPEKLNMLAEAAQKPVYLVGGTCRDALAGMHKSSADWDICAPLSAEELLSAAVKCGFSARAVYKNTGTVHLQADGENYEFTCFRSDSYVRGLHVPAEVCFTDDIYADARRRDFKCNAVYYDIRADKFVDPLGGIDDIKARRLSTVAPAKKVFGEDGLRLMRLCRIAGETGFSPDGECIEGARANSALVKDVSPERIYAELSLMLGADLKYGTREGHYAALELMKDIGLTEQILPELALGRGMAQRSDYHDHDVEEHSLRCVLYAPPQVRLAALLHDIGKPRAMLGGGSFIGHEEIGADISRTVLQRLRAPKRVSETVCELVRWHQYDFSCEARECKIRRFICAHYPVLEELLMLKQADFSACKDDLSPAPCVVKWKNILEAMKSEGAPFTVKQLAVRGDELIEAGICRDKAGKALNYLLQICAVEPKLNERARLIKRAVFACARGEF